ncbi:MAG: ABC transporter ATP-binding protein [Thermotogota bacterium]|nr:ABC transporter ATP-binding protein [Thermotogota bacterium]
MLLNIQEINKAFGTQTIIEKFSLSLQEGEFLSILGSSGCGKTTLLRLVSNLLKPDSGKIDRNYKRLGFVFQDTRLIPWKNALYNVSVVSSESKAKIMLSEVGLMEHHNKYPTELSGGMERRISLARALSIEPHLILLDEPFGSLDILTREDMIKLVLELWKKHNFAAINVTHDPYEAARLSTRVLVVGKHFTKTQMHELGSPLDRSETDNANIRNELLKTLKSVLD